MRLEQMHAPEAMKRGTEMLNTTADFPVDSLRAFGKNPLDAEVRDVR